MPSESTCCDCADAHFPPPAGPIRLSADGRRRCWPHDAKWEATIAPEHAAKLRAFRDARATREHFDTYETLALTCGIATVAAAVPFTAKAIRATLEVGDLPLNRLSMNAWDKAAGALPMPGRTTTANMPDFRWGPLPGWLAPLEAACKAGQRRWLPSLAERVCILKHVARHHKAGWPPPPLPDPATLPFNLQAAAGAP